MALTPKQQLFAEHFLRCFNATEAARRAGYNHGRSSEAGYELRNHPEIKKFMEVRMATEAMTTNELLRHLGEMARGEHGQYITEDGTFDVRRCVKDGAARHIKAIKKSKGETSYEFEGRLGALRTIAQGLGVLVDRKEISGPDKGPIRTQDVSRLDDVSDEELEILDRGARRRADARARRANDRGAVGEETTQ